MNWKKLLLIASVAGLLTFVPVQRSDAGVSVGIGFGFPAFYGELYRERSKRPSSRFLCDDVNVHCSRVFFI